MRQQSSFSIKKILFVIAAFFLVFVGLRLNRYIRSIVEKTGLTPVVMMKLLVNGGSTLASSDGRTNILLLGIPGGAHEGPDMTDTMIVISLELAKREITLLSVPRDIWSETLNDKVNSAYHYGEEKKKGGGMVMAGVILEDITGLPIHYVAVVDFSQFEKIIDIVGGIDIAVPVAFTDTEFPITGKENDACGGDLTYKCRYETISFKEGPQHMDGKTVLQYVRSRHAEGNEGTDFARNRRQQDVVIALKDKIMKLRPWFNPQLAIDLYHGLDAATDTNMKIGEQLTVAKIATRANSGAISKIFIEPFLMSPPLWMYGRYVLVPQKDFLTIHEYIKNELNK